MPSRRLDLCFAAVAAAAVVLSGCDLDTPPGNASTSASSGAPSPTRKPPTIKAAPSRSPRATTKAPTPSASTSSAARVARQRLAKLKVLPRPHGTAGYSRDAFGSPWSDIDGNGCNQRDDVLLRDSVRGTVRVGQQGRCDHDVLAGTWIDPYTGRTLHFTDLKDLHQAQAIQIDHIVPLAEAWVSGAKSWSDDRRRQYANTLSVLLAVDGPTNESKGDDDPAAWRPRKGYQCRYAVRWIAIKTTWHLAVDPSEVAALKQMLDYCR